MAEGTGSKETADQLAHILKLWPTEFPPNVRAMLQGSSPIFQGVCSLDNAKAGCVNKIGNMVKSAFNENIKQRIAFVNGGDALILEPHDDNYKITEGFYSNDDDFGIFVTKRKVNGIDVEGKEVDIKTLTTKLTNFYENTGNEKKIILCLSNPRTTSMQFVQDLNTEALKKLLSQEGGRMIKILGRQRKIIFKGTTKYIRYKTKLITLKEAKLLEKRS